MIPSRRRPTHPGKILEEEFLKPLNLTPKQFAQKLGNPWTEAEVNSIIQGERGISETAAHEFAKLLGTPVDFWHRLEYQYYHWKDNHPSRNK